MALEIITSADNPRIRHIAALQSRASQRKKEQLFVVEGLRLIADTPEAYLEETFVTQKFLESAPAGTAEKLSRTGYTCVSEQVMARMSDTKTPQGVLAAARMPVCRMEDMLAPREGRPPLLLFLEDIQDPGNLGTIFRTAEAAGVTGIIMSGGTVDVTNPKTVRSTMSALFREPFCTAEDLGDTVRRAKKAGIRTYAAHLKGTRDYDRVSYREPAAFLIGNEARGLREDTAELADEKIIIPMCGRIESLNAAMAAGILVFEAARQRRGN